VLRDVQLLVYGKRSRDQAHRAVSPAIWPDVVRVNPAEAGRTDKIELIIGIGSADQFRRVGFDTHGKYDLRCRIKDAVCSGGTPSGNPHARLTRTRHHIQISVVKASARDHRHPLEPPGQRKEVERALWTSVQGYPT
jgi:hypothetical protein